MPRYALGEAEQGQLVLRADLLRRRMRARRNSLDAITGASDMIDILATVHSAMRDRCIYRPIDIAQETKLDVKLVYPVQ